MLSFILSVTPKAYRNWIAELYEKYHDDMLRIARVRLRMVDDPNPEYNAEDIVQNAFLKIIETCETIDLNASEKFIRSYVVSITISEVYRFVERMKYYDSIDEDVEDPDESHILEDIISEEGYNEIVEAIKSLDEKYSITLYYYYVNDYTCTDIARMLGVPRNTVASRIVRGKARLIEKLNKKAKKKAQK